MEKEKTRFAEKFTDLDVWQKAFSISIEIHKASLTFPKIEQYALADQIRRSSKSVCANISEGFPKQMQSKIEFRRFLQMALASSNETLAWILYCKELQYVEEEIARNWYNEYLSICKMLNTMSQKLK